MREASSRPFWARPSTTAITAADAASGRSGWPAARSPKSREQAIAFAAVMLAIADQKLDAEAFAEKRFKTLFVFRNRNPKMLVFGGTIVWLKALGRGGF